MVLQLRLVRGRVLMNWRCVTLRAVDLGSRFMQGEILSAGHSGYILWQIWPLLPVSGVAIGHAVHAGARLWELRQNLCGILAYGPFPVWLRHCFLSGFLLLLLSSKKCPCLYVCVFVFFNWK